MTPSVTCYPQPGKPKSRALLSAFAAGAGGRVVDDARALDPGPAAFYGVVGLEALYRTARAGEWYYLDNAYFDCARGTHYRVGVNALQASGADGRPAWERFVRLWPGLKGWRLRGSKVLVCPQSDWYLREVAGYAGGQAQWLELVQAKIRAHTARTIHVRNWDRDKARAAGGFAQDLEDAWCVVVHSSAAANEALLQGVPVFCTGPCAALAMGSSDLSQIESPRRPENRAEWAARLAGLQWTVDELRDGTAWRTLHAA